MRNWICCLLVLFSSVIFPVAALEERHLMILCIDKAENQSQVNDIIKLLITYGFDNRSIAAVYLPPHSDGEKLAKELAKIGLFKAEKIHTDKRLMKPKPDLVNVYHEVEMLYPNGHVIFMLSEKPASALVQMLTQDEVHLKPASAYMIPLFKRQEVA